MPIKLGPGRHVLFDRFMSPEFLADANRSNPNLRWNCKRILQDKNHLKIAEDQTEFELIFRYTLVDALDINGILDDFQVDIEVGLEYNGKDLRDPMAWCVTNNDWAIGIQLRDKTEYHTLGPYIGIEGEAEGRARKLRDPRLTGEREETAASSNYWPRCFQMTFKPMEKIAACRTPIGDGHLFTARFDQDNPSFNYRKPIYLDAFRFKKADTYVINYVQVTAILTVR